MPFKSEAQRRYLWANEPEIARRWEDEMTPEGYSNSRNFGADTYDDLFEPSAMPFVTPDPSDPHPNASWSSTGDAEMALPTLDVRVDADGSVTTRAKYGPANQIARLAGGASP